MRSVHTHTHTHTHTQGGSASGLPELSVGAKVEIHSLLRAPDLNGAKGEIVEPQDPATGRWVVKIEEAVRVVKLKPSNLRCIMRARGSENDERISVSGFRFGGLLNTIMDQRASNQMLNLVGPGVPRDMDPALVHDEVDEDATTFEKRMAFVLFTKDLLQVSMCVPDLTLGVTTRANVMMM